MRRRIRHAQIVFGSRLFWGYVAAVVAAMSVVAPSPPQPVALVMNGLLAAVALMLVVIQSHAVVEIVDPRDLRTGEPCRRTAGHWIAFSWWQFWLFFFLRTLYAYVFNLLGRPAWMIDLPIINMLLVLVLISAAIQITIPFLVSPDDDKLTVRVANLDAGRVTQLGVIVLVIVASVAIWFVS
jgi:hypothetical protein